MKIIQKILKTQFNEVYVSRHIDEKYRTDSQFEIIMAGITMFLHYGFFKIKDNHVIIDTQNKDLQKFDFSREDEGLCIYTESGNVVVYTHKGILHLHYIDSNHDGVIHDGVQLKLHCVDLR